MIIPERWDRQPIPDSDAAQADAVSRQQLIGNLLTTSTWPWLRQQGSEKRGQPGGTVRIRPQGAVEHWVDRRTTGMFSGHSKGLDERYGLGSRPADDGFRRRTSLRAERLVGHEQFLDGPGRQRTREEEALGVRAPEALQLARLHVALDSFGDHAGVERSGQRQDALDDGRTVGEQQALHERAVDLERVDRKLVQVAQRRIAGPEVVEIDFHAEVAQLAEQLRGLVGAVHQRGLRDFEAEVARLQSGAAERACSTIHRKFCCMSCRLDTLTVMQSSPPAGNRRCQSANVGHACWSTHVPSGSMSPSSSAIGMNVTGETGLPLRVHRTSDSNPTHIPEASDTIGW